MTLTVILVALLNIFGTTQTDVNASAKVNTTSAKKILTDDEGG